MDLKKIVQNLRNDLGLHGNYPVVVKIPFNKGHIVEDKSGFYILALTKKNELYFHGITKFRYRYDKTKDFAIRLSPFKHYTFENVGKNLRQITLYNDEDYLPFYYFCNIKGSYEGENNAAYLCKEFDKLGIIEKSLFINNDKELSGENDEE